MSFDYPEEFSNSHSSEQQTKQSNKKVSGKFIAAPPKPLINPGEYRATLTKWELQRQFNCYKILFQFDVLVDDEIIRLTHFTNIKIDDDGRMIEPSPTMKCAKTLANLFPDSQFEDIDLNDLNGMKCVVVVRTVIKDSRKKDKPVNKHYSAIDEVFRDTDLERDPWEG